MYFVLFVEDRYFHPVGVILASNIDEAVKKTGLRDDSGSGPQPQTARHLEGERFSYSLISAREIQSPIDVDKY